MSAAHAKEVEKPQTNYPRAILLSVIIIFFIQSLGALSIATIVPKENIELASGTIDSISYFLTHHKLNYLH